MVFTVQAIIITAVSVGDSTRGALIGGFFLLVNTIITVWLTNHVRGSPKRRQGENGNPDIASGGDRNTGDSGGPGISGNPEVAASPRAE